VLRVYCSRLSEHSTEQVRVGTRNPARQRIEQLVCTRHIQADDDGVKDVHASIIDAAALSTCFQILAKVAIPASMDMLASKGRRYL
jgi:hypothetical protein